MMCTCKVFLVILTIIFKLFCSYFTVSLTRKVLHVSFSADVSHRKIISDAHVLLLFMLSLIIGQFKSFPSLINSDEVYETGVVFRCLLFSPLWLVVSFSFSFSSSLSGFKINELAAAVSKLTAYDIFNIYLKT